MEPVEQEQNLKIRNKDIENGVAAPRQSNQLSNGSKSQIRESPQHTNRAAQHRLEANSLVRIIKRLNAKLENYPGSKGFKRWNWNITSVS